MVFLHGQDEKGMTQTLTSFIHRDEASHGTPECVLELFALPDNAARELFETRPLTTFPGGDENLKVVDGWLKDCQSNHVFCQQHHNERIPLPKRLVEIGDASAVSLVETEGQFGQYVALSYCWGPIPENNSMTTYVFSSCIQAHQNPGYDTPKLR